MDDDWYEEAMAASRTIDRMARQFSIMRRALEAVAKERVSTVLDDQFTAARALEQCRRVDEELWKRIPHEGKVS